MKIKPILTAMAVAFAAIAQPAVAEFTQNQNGEATHYNGIPHPPIPTIEEARAQAQKKIAARKVREAEQTQQLAPRNPSPATPAQDVFFTGKPYIEETGQYAFLFRNYDPELSRWTTADPSGFPDGANNRAYVPIPTSQLDLLGLVSIRVTGTEGDVGANPLGFNTTIAPQQIGSAQAQKQIAWTRSDSNFSGWVIQEVNVEFEIFGLNGNRIEREPVNYLEAWIVSNGAFLNAGNNLDTFRTPFYNASATSGHITATGKAKLFQIDSEFANVPPSGWSTAAVGMAGGLPATNQIPSWWNSDNTISHFLAISWSE